MSRKRRSPLKSFEPKIQEQVREVQRVIQRKPSMPPNLPSGEYNHDPVTIYRWSCSSCKTDGNCKGRPSEGIRPAMQSHMIRSPGCKRIEGLRIV